MNIKKNLTLLIVLQITSMQARSNLPTEKMPQEIPNKQRELAQSDQCGQYLVTKALMENYLTSLRADVHNLEQDFSRSTSTCPKTPITLASAIEYCKKIEKNERQNLSPEEVKKYKTVRAKLEKEHADLQARETTEGYQLQDPPESGYYKLDTWRTQHCGQQIFKAALRMIYRQDICDCLQETIKILHNEFPNPECLKKAIEVCKKNEQNENGDFSPKQVDEWKAMREQFEKKLLAAQG